MSLVDELPVAGTVILMRDTSVGLETLLIRRPDHGSFPGAWVFPGGKVEGIDREPGAAEVDDARRAGIRETFEEVGVKVVDPVALSRWHPPVEAPARIRTWFFLAQDPGGTLVPSPDEVVDTGWMRPSDALDRHATGTLTLFPPTWVTLLELSAYDDARTALEAASEPRRYTTEIERTPDGQVFVWGADRLVTGALPWRYVRG